MNENTQAEEAVELSQDHTQTLYWSGKPIRVTRTMSGILAFYAQDIVDALEISREDYGKIMELRPELEFAFPENGSLILEPGIYFLMFTSETEASREFVVWVTNNVLPEIRKFGSYVEKKEDSPSVLLELRNEAAMSRELQESRYQEMSDHLSAVTQKLTDMATIIHTSSFPIDENVQSSKIRKKRVEKPFTDEQNILYKILHEQAAQTIGSRRNAGASFAASFSALFYDPNKHQDKKVAGGILGKLGTIHRNGLESAGVEEYLDCCRNVIGMFGLTPVTIDIWDEGLSIDSDDDRLAFIELHSIGKPEFKFTPVDDIVLKDIKK